MSAATIDRLLAAKRRRLRLKGMSHTKPGSLLKSQIPVRTVVEWDQGRPGDLTPVEALENPRPVGLVDAGPGSFSGSGHCFVSPPDVGYALVGRAGG